MSPISPLYEPPPKTDSLEVYALGAVDYPSMLALQERLAYELSGRRDKLGVLLICEHPAVVSVGCEGSHRDFAVSSETFESRLMNIHWVSRGGGNLVHAPGQLAVYPILPLDRLQLGIAEFRKRLQQTMKTVCQELRVPVELDAEGCGISGRTGRLGTIGTSVKSWVSQFGFYLNVQPNLDLLRMCRYADSELKPSSLAAVQMKPMSMSSVRESAVRNLAAQFDYQKLHWYTGHPLLARTKKKVYVHA